MGGTFQITAIVVFLIIVNCFLAFSVNYTKAFRAKNEIRSIIEKHEGLNCNNGTLEQIAEFMAKNNYHINKSNFNGCRSAGYKVASYNGVPLFCYKVEKVDSTGGQNEKKVYKGAYYTIVTYVDVNIPLFNRIFEKTNFFMVKGETAIIYSSGVNYEGVDKCGGAGL